MRVGVVDLGSCSFHLMVADVHSDGRISPVKRKRAKLHLSLRMASDGRIPEAVAAQGLKATRKFRSIASRAGVDDLVCVATSALRHAANGPELIRRFEIALGAPVQPLDGEAEARLAFLGISRGMPMGPEPTLCLDLGGGSLEIAVGDASGLHRAVSLDLGVGRLMGEIVRHDPPTPGERAQLSRRIEASLGPAAKELGPFDRSSCVATGGTVKALARLGAVHRGMDAPPLSVHRLTLSAANLHELHERLIELPGANRRRLPRLDPGRAELIGVGAAVVHEVTRALGLQAMSVSEWGLREGVILERAGARTPLAIPA